MGLLDMFFTPTKKELYEDDVGELKEQVLIESWTVKFPTYPRLRYDLDTPVVEWEHRIFTEENAANRYAAKLKEAMSLIAPVLKRHVKVYKNSEEKYV